MVKDLEASARQFVAEVKDLAGPSLRAVVLFGSAASGSYEPGRSDLNFLLIVDPIELPLLDRFQRKIGPWQRKRIATPVIVPRAFLVQSTDSYPLEILGMMAGYRVLLGEDPLGDLTLKKEHVRLQVEREVKAKALLLRRGYMESCGKHPRLLDMLAGALPAVDAILRGMLFLQDADWRRSGEALHARCADQLGIDPAILDAVRLARCGRGRPGRNETISIYGKMLELLRTLGRTVEGMATTA